MSNPMTKSQIEDLLDNVLHTPKRNDWKGDKIQFCCTIHGESHPSCGININYKPKGSNDTIMVFNCFSCGASGTIPWLVYKSLPDQFKSVKEVETFLNKRYGVTFKYTFDPKTKRICRYEDQFIEPDTESRLVLPLKKLAVFKSGKETYKYFFDRGFSKEDLIEYKIGRDTESKTVTVPIFWEDGKLAGIIGRFISKNVPHNSRYKIYEFPRGKILYPLDKLEVTDNTIIGVESVFDVMLLRKWGYKNAVATMGGGFSEEQAEIIAEKCTTFIGLFDNDSGGRKIIAKAKSMLKGKVMFLTPTYYPEQGKDPGEWGEEETVKVINSAKAYSRSIPRL